MHIGVKGELSKWISNYLQNRFQKTLANNVLSEAMPVNCGVPQGSILGPLFFVLYINDVKKYIDDAEIRLYADDTVILSHNKDWHAAQENLQRKLNGFVEWSKLNELTVNSQKLNSWFLAPAPKSKKQKTQNC